MIILFICVTFPLTILAHIDRIKRELLAGLLLFFGFAGDPTK